MISKAMMFKYAKDGHPEIIIRETMETIIRYFRNDYARDFNTPWRKDLERGIRQHIKEALK